MTSDHDHKQRLIEAIRSLLQARGRVNDFVDQIVPLWRSYRDAYSAQDPAISQESRELVERRLRGELDSAAFDHLYSKLWRLDRPNSDAKLFDEFHSLCDRYTNPLLPEDTMTSSEFVQRVKDLVNQFQLSLDT